MNFRMAKRRRISEGKAKVLFEGPEPGTLVQYFKDDATTFDNRRPSVVTGKGVLNNRISEHLMGRLNEIGVPTHFMRRLNMREQLVRQVESIPVLIAVRNVAAGAFAKRLGIPEGTQLPRSIIELSFKNEELGDPMISDEHVTAFGWASPHDLDDMMALSLRVNDYLSGLFLGIGLRLVDFQLEFGRCWDSEEMRIVLADDITPDNCRLWDIKTNEAVAETTQEVARRLGVWAETPVPTEASSNNITSIREKKK